MQESADQTRTDPSWRWVGTDQLPVFAANQVATEIIDIDEIVVTLGHAGSVRHDRSSELTGEGPSGPTSSLAVLGVARIGLTSKRLGELIEVLRETQIAHEHLRERSMGLEDGGA